MEEIKESQLFVRTPLPLARSMDFTSQIAVDGSTNRHSAKFRAGSSGSVFGVYYLSSPLKSSSPRRGIAFSEGQFLPVTFLRCTRRILIWHRALPGL